MPVRRALHPKRALLPAAPPSFRRPPPHSNGPPLSHLQPLSVLESRRNISKSARPPAYALPTPCSALNPEANDP
ncbi:hypothetical protein NDU88_003166 [Pleurodeles waltl]|uniref:Uncharacterized protein n=1 Tax=Pleurodeles waltl TaxID=8319 RepID=A0AAV7NFU0_PLEWA|nr:hypothetical protein NDU88_003166 [Pleurodeles waltl]